MTHSLEVYRDQELIFSSDGKWLYPLFELKVYLEENHVHTEQLEVKDKIVGRAAALVMVYLGIRKISAGLLSQPGKEVLDRNGIHYRYETLIASVSCRTEELLKDIHQPAQAYAILKKRAIL